MDSRRQFIKKATLAGGLVGLGGVNTEWLNTAVNYPGKARYLKFTSGKSSFPPLEEVEISSTIPGNIKVYDSAGREYHSAVIKTSIRFKTGGNLGPQFICLTDRKGILTDLISFRLDAHTEIKDENGFWKNLLSTLYFSMLGEFGQAQVVRIDNKFYHFFVRWLRDHVHTLKGMKYFYPELKTGIELYSDFQREDGMIWDNIYERNENPNFWEVRFGYGNFIRIIENFRYELKRIPVENDVEYLFLEGLYYTWKATGDDEWMSSLLDKAIKAVHYSFNDPYRWSSKYQLLKRGYTIDTWDFQSSYDVERSGDPMVVKLDKTEFGIMFGDNTGMSAGLLYLSEMLRYSGRSEEAEKYKNLSFELKDRLDKLCWNGRHYIHHVPENPAVKRDFGTDTSKQVSLSNAYSINRNLSHEQAVAIIKTYQGIRQQMPKDSPGEWYTIYPPFERGFGDHNSIWEYMNGGVCSIVAGELAHGAFEHGFEEYGVDILKRIASLATRTKNYLHCTYKGNMPSKPERSFETIKLDRFANTDTSGTGAKGVPGWTGEGENDLHEFPSGKQVFHEIPFDLTDPSANGRKACLGISSRTGYAREMIIPIDKKAGSVYLLQTRGGSAGQAGLFTIIYSDGTEHKEYMSEGRIGNWWFPDVSPPMRGRVMTVTGWRGRNKFSNSVGAYLAGIDNPFPEKKIREFKFNALENNAIWMVLGISLSTSEVYFEPPIVSYGIPDNWGAAANVYALVEGLAGIKDEGSAFNRCLLSPRWTQAGTNNVDVTVKYEASGGYSSYRYKLSGNTLRIEFTGSADTTRLHVLLPGNRVPSGLKINGTLVPVVTKRIENSLYLDAEINQAGVHLAEIEM